MVGSGKGDALGDHLAKAAMSLEQLIAVGAAEEARPDDADATAGSNGDGMTQEDAFWAEEKARSFTCPSRGDAASGRFDRWRHRDAKNRADYEAIQGNENMTKTQAKAEFRREWLQSEYRAQAESKTDSKKQVHKLVKEGRFNTLLTIASLKGGGNIALGLDAAVEHCKHCVHLGRSFFKRDEFTKQVEFTYVEQRFDHVFSHEQTITKTLTQDAEGAGQLPPTAESLAHGEGEGSEPH